MKRKVIKQANQAFTITLPIEWVRENNITNKTELDLEIFDKTLVLSTFNKQKLIKEKFNVSSLNERGISRIIKAFYARGVDEIELSSDNDISSLIIKHLHDTLGYALIENTKKSFIIKDLGGTNYENLDEVFKRVFQMILSFYDSALIDIYGKQTVSIEDLITRDIEINKFCLFLERSINKKSYKNPIDARIMFTFSFALEIIADEIQRFWRSFIKYKPKLNNIKKSSEKISKCLELAFVLYYQFNPLISEEIVLLRDSIREDSLKLSKDKYENQMMHHLVKIADELADLSHLTLMMKI